jgi:DNA-directed RNA polymerase subunit K/omega
VSEGALGTHGEPIEYTRFERARILGARALQISLGAPMLVDPPVGLYDPVSIAESEFAEHVLPITVRRGSPRGVTY